MHKATDEVNNIVLITHTCTIQVAQLSGFAGHECKQYITVHSAPKVLKFIASAGLDFCA